MAHRSQRPQAILKSKFENSTQILTQRTIRTSMTINTHQYEPSTKSKELPAALHIYRSLLPGFITYPRKRVDLSSTPARREHIESMSIRLLGSRVQTMENFSCLSKPSPIAGALQFMVSSPNSWSEASRGPLAPAHLSRKYARTTCVRP
eukprot:6183232-Pleurochrysis_carterae.AAC.1